MSPMRPWTFLARRFVAGESAPCAIDVGRRLKARGIRATFDLLGEDVKDVPSALRIAEANEALLRLIPPEIEANVSVKLTNLGLDVAQSLCLELGHRVLEVARDLGGLGRGEHEAGGVGHGHAVMQPAAPEAGDRRHVDQDFANHDEEHGQQQQLPGKAEPLAAHGLPGRSGPVAACHIAGSVVCHGQPSFLNISMMRRRQRGVKP